MSSTQSPSGSQRPLVGILLIILATFLFTSHDAMSKFLAGFYPVVMVVWLRYVVHSLLMACIFLPRTGLSVLRTRHPVLQTLRALCLLGTSLFFTAALKHIPMAEATAVNFLAPLLVTALSVPLLGERVTLGQWLAVISGFLGVLIMLRPGGALFNLAVLLPLMSMLCFTFYQLLTRRVSRDDSASTSNFFAGLCNTLIVSLMVPFFWHWPSSGHLLLMIALGSFGMCSHLSLAQAFRHGTPALLAPFSYCQLVFAVLMGLLVFGQLPEVSALLGIGVIAASGVAAAWLQRRPV